MKKTHAKLIRQEQRKKQREVECYSKTERNIRKFDIETIKTDLKIIGEK